MLNYLVIGIYMGAALPAVPRGCGSWSSIVVVTILNIVGIVSVSWANVVIIGMQTVFIVVFVAMSVVVDRRCRGRQLARAARPATAPSTASRPIFTGAALLCLSFLGFDAVSTLSEEAKDAKRTVPKAIMIATMLSGFIYFALSYVSQLVFPSNAFEDRTSVQST